MWRCSCSSVNRVAVLGTLRRYICSWEAALCENNFRNFEKKNCSWPMYACVDIFSNLKRCVIGQHVFLSHTFLFPRNPAKRMNEILLHTVLTCATVRLAQISSSLVAAPVLCTVSPHLCVAPVHCWKKRYSSLSHASLLIFDDYYK